MNILAVAGGFMGVALIPVIIWAIYKPIKALILSKINEAKEDLIKKINDFRDPELRDIIMQLIVYAQKKLAGKSGKEKFEFAKNKVLELCPDMLDSSVEDLIQTIYDEAINPVFKLKNKSVEA